MLARTLLVAGAMLLGAAGSVAARDLAIALPPGPLADEVKRVFVKPFADAAGLPVALPDWDGTLASLKDAKEGGPPVADLAVLHGDLLAIGCEDGSLERLDWSQIGGRDRYLPIAVSDCGVGTAVYATVLAWDRDKFAATPSWSDFWDVTKYPGKRGLKRGPETNLEFALMADGVAPGDVYRVLRSNDGVDRAFRKLDQLRPYLVWWQTSKEAAAILAAGDVLMTSAINPAIAAANHAPKRTFGVQWAGSLSRVESWAVPKGGPNLRQANQFLYVAGSSAIQGRLTALSGYGGSAKGSNDNLSADAAAASPTATANLAAAIPFDEQFWRENRERLGQRFEQWLKS